MRAFVFEIRPLFLSHKSPTAYQVKTSNILPPPSTLLGAIYKNYVGLTNLDYSEGTLKGFLKAVKFAGMTVIPSSPSKDIVVKRSAVLLKHHRLERGARERGDAMAREFVFIDGRILGLVAVEGPVSQKAITEAVEGIEYIGNSESLVSVQMLDADAKVLDAIDARRKGNGGIMMQMVSSDAKSLPSVGIIEQCGKVPERPWGARDSKDVCYVWNPLEPLGKDRYQVLRFSDRVYIAERKFMLVHSDRLGEDLVLSPDGFESLYW